MSLRQGKKNAVENTNCSIYRKQWKEPLSKVRAHGVVQAGDKAQDCPVKSEYEGENSW